jgi:hypothetical protein
MLEWRHTAISESTRYFTTIASAGCAHFQGSRRLISSVIWIIARASVGVARINFIEHIIDYLPIVHVGLEAG